ARPAEHNLRSYKQSIRRLENRQGAVLVRPLFRLPLVYFLVMPSQENPGHTVLFLLVDKGLWSSIDVWASDPFLFNRQVIAKHPGNMSGDGVDHCHGRQFTSRKHVWPDGNIYHRKYLLDTRVYSFIAATDENNIAVLFQ